VAETESGLDVMRSRIKRASRQAPPPRRATRESAPVPGPPPTSTESTPTDERHRPDAASDAPKAKSRRSGITIAPDTPSVNLAIRVRRPLDDRLADLIHALRREGVRTSKVELVELLLWELPDQPTAELRRRLGAFREAAPRNSGSTAEL
jgi:hypothetical protein